MKSKSDPNKLTYVVYIPVETRIRLAVLSALQQKPIGEVVENAVNLHWEREIKGADINSFSDLIAKEAAMITKRIINTKKSSMKIRV